MIEKSLLSNISDNMVNICIGIQSILGTRDGYEINPTSVEDVPLVREE